MDIAEPLSDKCDEIEKQESPQSQLNKQCLGSNVVENTKECIGEDQDALKKVKIESNPTPSNLDVNVDHSKCAIETNNNNFNIKIKEENKILEFEDEKFHEMDEHDDYDDLEEEDLHAGENFWCSLCDDGGDLLFCDGPCLRTFHACISAKKDHDCKTLGFTKEQYQIIVNAQTWICPNCKTNQQLCFLCHQLGNSIGPNQEVFNCHSAHCGQFYHPTCIAKWVTSDKEKQKAFAESIQQNVETFLCPLHTCKSCKKLEDATNTEKKFAKCRRCPVGWHVDCLPKNILFEDEAEAREIPQRAWKVELGDEKHHYCVGIYCPKHDLPVCPYDMVKFPYRPDSEFKCMEGSHTFHETTTKEFLQSKNSNKKKQQFEKYKHSSPRTKRNKLLEQRKFEEDNAEGHYLFDEHKSKQPLESNDRSSKEIELVKNKAYDAIEEPQVSLVDIKKSVDNIISKSRNQKTMEDVKKILWTPSYYIDKNGEKEGKFIHEGELISIIVSIPKALNWIKSGRQIDEAKALCPLRSIIQLERVEKALEAFLNPCLHGQRYTSFGRHFTKKEILIEIVDRLQWYIRDKDMIVDFCCGANEFSTEIHGKLNEVGKKNCTFKNFDILAPKNEFHFEQRDWFTIQRHELPSSDKLIMGLNPPFGKRSVLANAFIDRAIVFRPKIIILIVPPSTKRLEEHGYELIWEDPRLLGGQAFYLPGSISKDIKDANGNTRFTTGEDWNKNTPPLYLWSRKDWVVDHLEIAQQHGHINDPSTNGESHKFNVLYKSKVDWDKINSLKLLQQQSIVERPTKSSLEIHKDKGNGQDVTTTRSGCSIEKTLQMPVETTPPTLLKDPMKMPLETLDIPIDNNMTLKPNLKRQKLLKKSSLSVQEINTKDDVKDVKVEKISKDMEQSVKRNKNKNDSKNNSNVNECFEKPYRDVMLEGAKQTIDENKTKESRSMQHEMIKEKRKNIPNFSEETKHVDEGLKHTNDMKFENNVHKKYPSNRLKRARSPSMMFDCGNALDSKVKKINENYIWKKRDLKRPFVRNEKQTSNNVFDPTKDTIHQERLAKHDADTSHCNKSNMAQEDIESDHTSRTHHRRQNIEHDQVNKIQNGRREDIEQGRANRTRHRRRDIEQGWANRIHHGRENIEQGQHGREIVEQGHHGRENIEQGRINRTHHGREDIEQGQTNRMHHRRQKIELEHANKIHQGRHHNERKERSHKQNLEMTKDYYVRNNLRYKDPKRTYNDQDLSIESRQLMGSRGLRPKSRQIRNLHDIEIESRSFRPPQETSPKSQHRPISFDMHNEQRLEVFDKHGFKNYDHDIKKSPEQSKEVGMLRSQCIEDESKPIAYPKWFTAQAQTSTGGFGRVEGSTNLPTNLGSEFFEKDHLKFPTLHGNYGSHDFSMHSQAHGNDYLNLSRNNYMDVHSPKITRDYSNPQETSSLQRNNYDNFGIHNSPEKLNNFDVESDYTNQRYGTNTLHSFDHLDRNIQRDYGINNFSKNSLMGVDIPTLSKNNDEDSWRHLSQKNGLLNSYRDHDINPTSIARFQNYSTSWNNPISSSSLSSFRRSPFENLHISSLESSWNQPNLYPLPSTSLMPFSQRELWP